MADLSLGSLGPLLPAGEREGEKKYVGRRDGVTVREERRKKLFGMEETPYGIKGVTE